MSELTHEMQARDDGKDWGFMIETTWIKLPKTPMLLANLGPPPFEVAMPGRGTTRMIVHAPAPGTIKL
jgi:hypothetical protein